MPSGGQELHRNRATLDAHQNTVFKALPNGGNFAVASVTQCQHMQRQVAERGMVPLAIDAVGLRLFAGAFGKRGLQRRFAFHSLPPFVPAQHPGLRQQAFLRPLLVGVRRSLVGC